MLPRARIKSTLIETTRLHHNRVPGLTGDRQVIGKDDAHSMPANFPLCIFAYFQQETPHMPVATADRDADSKGCRQARHMRRLRLSGYSCTREDVIRDASRTNNDVVSDRELRRKATTLSFQPLSTRARRSAQHDTSPRSC